MSEFHPTCQARIPSEAGNLVLEYLSLVKAIAWQVYRGLPYHAAVELNDILQAGHLGLVNASQAYRSEFRVPFASYARHRIRGEILDSLRRQDMASRNLRGWQRRMEQSAHYLTLSLSRDPTDEEMSRHMGVAVIRLRKKRVALLRVSGCLQPETGERGVFGPADVSENGPESLQERRQLTEFMARAVARLPERPKQVIEYYYLQNLPMKEIGRRLQVNESRVSQIHKLALERMARGLRASGIRSARDLGVPN